MNKKTQKKQKSKKRFLIIPFILCIIILLVCISHNKNNNTSSNSEAHIEYSINNIFLSLEDNKIFNNDAPIIITWDIDEEGNITYPDKKSKAVTKGVSLTQPGEYIIKIGKTSKKFIIIEEKIERYITYNDSTNTIKFNNINDIVSINIDNNLFTKENNNIPTNYTFTTRGRYTVIINTVTGKSLSQSYRISNNI